jgi:D-alanyl-D-alanine carboxypeptidase
MKKFLFILTTIIFVTGCQKEDYQKPTSPVCVDMPINNAFSKSASLNSIMKKYANAGLPGVAMAVYIPAEGYWAGSAGYAKIENKTTMKPCHVQYLQSVTKTYMAVVMLKIYEEGKIDLDAPITRYLPAKYAKHITTPEKITVRHLLNHQSGIPEYTEAPGYVTYLLQHPLHVFTTEELLSFISKKPLQFQPGSQHKYINTNYELLALIADAIVGNHAQYLQHKVLSPLGLTNTFYRRSVNYLDNNNLVNSYWSRFGDLKLENNSGMQKANVASMMGDDGLIASPLDAVRFLRNLLEGNILSPSSLQLMKTFVPDKNGKPTYGFGLYRYEQDGIIAFGHGGSGLGAGCILYYFPQNGMVLFLSTNVGTVTESPYTAILENFKNEILGALL